jgi:NADH dehydrogenase FAD-containing subunit
LLQHVALTFCRLCCVTWCAGLATTCWGTDQLKQQYPQLNEDTDADVAVVGGGISGLTTAYLLAKAGEALQQQCRL